MTSHSQGHSDDGKGEMMVSVDGAELFCASSGAGPACLVLSGIGAKPYQRQMPERLGDHLTLVHVDLRGSGRSTGQAADLTFDVLADDLEAVRTRLGAERIAVLGHSVLGALAIEYGRRRPGSVSHVIAAGTPPGGDMTQLLARSRAFFEADASPERKRILADNLAKLGSGASPWQGLLAQTPMRFFDATFDPTPLFAEADIQPQFLPHVMGTLTRAWDVLAGDALRVPLFIAHGRCDYTVPYTLWDDVLPRLPTATRHLFERSGHQPFFEEPDVFTSALLAWMQAAPVPVRSSAVRTALGTGRRAAGGTGSRPSRGHRQGSEDCAGCLECRVPTTGGLRPLVDGRADRTPARV